MIDFKNQMILKQIVMALSIIVGVEFDTNTANNYQISIIEIETIVFLCKYFLKTLSKLLYLIPEKSKLQNISSIISFEDSENLLHLLCDELINAIENSEGLV